LADRSNVSSATGLGRIKNRNSKQTTNEFAKGFESRLQLGYDAGERERIKIDSLRRKNNVDPLVISRYKLDLSERPDWIRHRSPFLTMYDIIIQLYMNDYLFIL
jgi:hypothetical protein